MSLTVNSNNNTYYAPISQEKIHEHTLDQYAGCTIEQLENAGCRQLTPLSEEEARQLNSKPVFLYRDIDVFARKGLSKESSNTYIFVDSVMFSAEELKACNEVVNQALDMLPVKGGSLDYHDYAAMGIAANIVYTYADENLSKLQANVLKKAMDTYLNDYIQAEQDIYQKDNYFSVDDMYYNLREIPEETERKAVEELIESASKLPNGAGARLVQRLNEYLQNGAATVMSATNQYLTNEVMSLFKNVDLRDDSAVDQAFKTYQQLVAPAYSLRSTKGIDDQIEVQLSNARAMINNIGKTVDCIV